MFLIGQPQRVEAPSAGSLCACGGALSWRGGGSVCFVLCFLLAFACCHVCVSVGCCSGVCVCCSLSVSRPWFGCCSSASVVLGDCGLSLSMQYFSRCSDVYSPVFWSLSQIFCAAARIVLMTVLVCRLPVNLASGGGRLSCPSPSAGRPTPSNGYGLARAPVPVSTEFSLPGSPC